MSIEKQLLKNLGLSDTEAEVYIGALESGEGSVLTISRASGVKRSTCYITLDSLAKRGFVSKLEKKGRTVYAVMDPRVILHDFESKLADFRDLLPFYRSRFNRGTKPKIYFYEGKEELEHVYKRILFTEPTKNMYALGTDVEKLEKVFPDLYNYWEKKYLRLKKYKKTKEIVSNNSESIAYAKEKGDNRPIRVMPKNLPVHSDTVITDTRLFIVSLENLFGILIESEDLAETYKNFFLLAWESALKP